MGTGSTWVGGSDGGSWSSSSTARRYSTHSCSAIWIAAAVGIASRAPIKPNSVLSEIHELLIGQVEEGSP